MLRQADFIFTLDESKQTESSANALRNPFTVKEVRLFKQAPPNLSSTMKSGTLIFLGHTSDNGKNYLFGNYTAKEFAIALAKKFDKNRKSQLKHLCLLGCEAGLIHSDGISFAQQVADEMHQQGFTMQVHAFSQRVAQNGEAMYVEIKHHALMSNISGYADVYLMSKRDAEALDKLKDEYESLPAENKKKKQGTDISIEMQKIKSDEKRILSCVNPALLLSRAVNTFIPLESIAQRKDRIDNDLYTQTVLLLNQHIQYEIGKGNNKLANKLRRVLGYIEHADSADCQNILKKYKKKYSGSTHDLLKKLRDNQLPEARVQVGKYTTNNRVSSPATNSVLSATPSTNRPIRQEIDKLEKEVDDRIKELEKEVKAIRPCCLFPFFSWYEINTKKEKIKALTNIRNSSTVDEKAIAIHDALNNSRVMRSQKTSRTKDLLAKMKTY